MTMVNLVDTIENDVDQDKRNLRLALDDSDAYLEMFVQLLLVVVSVLVVLSWEKLYGMLDATIVVVVSLDRWRSSRLYAYSVSHKRTIHRHPQQQGVHVDLQYTLYHLGGPLRRAFQLDCHLVASLATQTDWRGRHELDVCLR